MRLFVLGTRISLSQNFTGEEQTFHIDPPLAFQGYKLAINGRGFKD